jgi:hypothetical protein
LSKKDIKIKFDELSSDFGLLKGLRARRIFDEEWKEPMARAQEQDIPFTMKKEIIELLQETDWVEGKISSLDPSLLDRMIRRRE